MSHHHQSTATNTTTTTFEQRSAIQTLQKSPDPIHYNPNYSYRNQPYRLLHHQKGVIGNFHVRIVEGKGLKRNHWSVLGLGVVKHLGLSNAHGEVSSYGNFRLGFRQRRHNNRQDRNNYNGKLVQQEEDQQEEEEVQQFGTSVATATATAATATAAAASLQNTQNTSHHQHHNHNIIYTNNNKTYQSSTIPSNSSPKWPSVQTSTNKSSFQIPLYKGSMPVDGMEIILSIQMKEEKSAADTFVNYVPVVGGGIIGQGGSGSMDYDYNYNKRSNHGDGSGLLGVGEINLTGLVLRDNYYNYSNSCGEQGDEVVDVYDEWITLSNPIHQQQQQQQQQQHGNKDKHSNDYGKVRLLISYEPNGYKPQKNDIVAFESFARQPNNVTSQCPSIVPLLHPFKVKDVKGEYILAVYDTFFGNHNFNTHQQQQQQQQQQLYKNDLDYQYDDDDDNINYYHSHLNSHNRNSPQSTLIPKQGSIRIHRNSIFVIERTNLLDNAINISLTPTDILLSTPLGQNVTDATQPYIEAAGDLLAPVILSSKLLLEAGKVGGGALAIGLKSAVVSVVQSSDPEKRRRAKRNSFYDD
jgi:hypothetical protein